MKLKKSIALILMLCILQTFSVYAENVDEVNLYVSPQGNIAASGSIDDPFGSILQAKSKIVKLKKENPERAFNVFFREGSYYINDTVKFTDVDSGSEKYPICYKAYPNEGGGCGHILGLFILLIQDYVCTLQGSYIPMTV